MTAVKRMNNLKHAFMFQMLHVQLARWQCRTSHISISTRQQMALACSVKRVSSDFLIIFGNISK